MKDDTFWTVLGKNILGVLLWLGSWKLGEWQALVGIVSGLIVAGFAGTQWYVLWRDKVKRKHSRWRDTTMPATLGD